MPTLQVYAGVSSFENISPVGMPSLQLGDNISSLQIRSKPEIENFSFGTPFKKFSPD
jgi:hypothetical protein